MPPDNFLRDAIKHIAEAWRNYCLFEQLLDLEPSWALVLLFYSAVHLVQAHAENMCSKNPRISFPGDHTQRRWYISQHLQRIVADYRELQTASEGVRYQMERYRTPDVLTYYEEEFSRILEDLHKKGVSWELRLSEEERDAIRDSVLKKGG